MHLLRHGLWWIVAALAAAVVGQPRQPVVVAGRGVLKTVSPVSGETFSLELKVHNALNEPLKVTRAESFFACQGGWSVSLGEMIAEQGKFLTRPTVLDARGNYEYGFGWDNSIPVTHYVLAFQVEGPGLGVHNELFQVPFVRARHQAPPPLRINGTVFIGLQEPVEVLELSSGEVWLPIVGQIINVSGKPLSLLGWRFRVRSAAGKVVLDRDLNGTLPLKEAKASLNEFYYGFALPADFQRGTLEIDAEIDLGGRRGPVTHIAPVERVAGVTIQSPVEGNWTWGNGPGDTAFVIHLHFPEQRYAYDIGVFKDVRGERRTFDGDEFRNESYFCWDQPIHCAKDGTVLIVSDDVPDNFGHRGNPANTDTRNSCIAVEHEGQTVSAYFHVRQGSAAVKVGQRVRAGQVLGRVGNAGASSEPHLHFALHRFDATGRYRNVPVNVVGLSAAEGRVRAGVPRSPGEYRSAVPR